MMKFHFLSLWDCRTVPIYINIYYLPAPWVLSLLWSELGCFYKTSEMGPPTNTRSMQTQRRGPKANLESRAIPLQEPKAHGCPADSWWCQVGLTGAGYEVRLGSWGLPANGKGSFLQSLLPAEPQAFRNKLMFLSLVGKFLLWGSKGWTWAKTTASPMLWPRAFPRLHLTVSL